MSLTPIQVRASALPARIRSLRPAPRSRTSPSHSARPASSETGAVISTVWPISEGFGALVRVRGRQDDGMRELARLHPELMGNFTDRPDRAEIRRLAAADPLGFATYAGVNLATRLRRQRGGWVRNR